MLVSDGKTYIIHQQCQHINKTKTKNENDYFKTLRAKTLLYITNNDNPQFGCNLWF